MYRNRPLSSPGWATTRSPCVRRWVNCGRQPSRSCRSPGAVGKRPPADHGRAVRDLDEGEIKTLFEVVRRLTAEGVGVIYISHRLDEIRRIGDRVSVLADGRTTGTGLLA